MLYNSISQFNENVDTKLEGTYTSKGMIRMIFLGIRLVQIMLNSILIILFCFGLYSIIWNIYLTLITFKGFGQIKRDYEIEEDKTRFLLLVAAHNEENVIGSTIDSLRMIDYDKSLYDIVIINDNCTDRTLEICKSKKVKYVDTSLKKFEREGVGKPGGIQYALRDIGFENIKNNYDLVMVFDADNHASSNLLKEVNSQFINSNNPEAIQVYIDSKNSTSSIALGYSLSFFINNRFLQYARYKKKLPVYIGGTGFAIRSDYIIDKGGFKCNSLTEDLEFAVDIWLSGGKIVWNHFARVYDEKPDSLKVSIKQRIRWCKGHSYVAIKSFKNIIKNAMSKKDLKVSLDIFIHLFSIGRSLQYIFLLLGLFISTVGFVISRFNVYIGIYTIQILSSMAFIGGLGVLLLIYNYIILPAYCLKHDFNDRLSIRHILALLLYSFSFIYPQMKGLIKWRDQSVWVKTQHVYNDRFDLDSEKSSNK